MYTTIDLFLAALLGSAITALVCSVYYMKSMQNAKRIVDDTIEVVKECRDIIHQQAVLIQSQRDKINHLNRGKK